MHEDEVLAADSALQYFACYCGSWNICHFWCVVSDGGDSQSPTLSCCFTEFVGIWGFFYEWRRHWQRYRLSELAAQLLFFCTGSFWDIRPRKTYAIDLSNRPANRRSSCPRCHITSCQSCNFLFFISIRFRSTTPAEWPLYQRTTRIANNSLTENVYASYCARCLGRFTHRQLCSGICLSTLRSGIK